MMTRVLHALTDASTSRRGKFVTIALWLLCAVVLTVAVLPPSWSSTIRAGLASMIASVSNRSAIGSPRDKNPRW